MEGDRLGGGDRGPRGNGPAGQAGVGSGQEMMLMVMLSCRRCELGCRAGALFHGGGGTALGSPRSGWWGKRTRLDAGQTLIVILDKRGGK